MQHVVQFILAVSGLTALWMAMGTDNPRANRWAPVVGLVGQPAWLWFAYSSQAWGLFILSIAYGGVYVRGIWLHWRKR